MRGYQRGIRGGKCSRRQAVTDAGTGESSLAPLLRGEGRVRGSLRESRPIDGPVPPHPDRISRCDPTSPRKRGEARNSRRDISAHSHDAISPEFCKSLSLSWKGRRESRAPTAPAAPCAKRKQRTRVVQVQPRHPGFPHAMVLRFIRALPGERRFLSPLPTRTGGLDRRHGRGARTTRLRRTLRDLVRRANPPDAAASIASRPTYRDDHEASLGRAGVSGPVPVICPTAQGKFLDFTNS